MIASEQLTADREALLMKPFFAATRFLTIIPVPQRWCGDENELPASIPFFPVVGLIIGILVSSIAIWLAALLPPAPLAVIVVMLLVGISGGLHIDGLADTADGFLSSRPRERILEIMRDSRSGPMGIVTLVCIILLKVETVACLSNFSLCWAILLMPLAGRCAIVLQMCLFPYVRTTGGLATAFCQRRSRWPAAWAMAVLILTGWYLAHWNGLWAAGLSIATAFLFSLWCYRKIGGFTGDTLGAVCEITELVPVLVAAVVNRP